MSTTVPEGLTGSQQEAFQAFVDITNWSQDPQLAVVLLRSCEWNVEQAVTAHFDGTIMDEDDTPDTGSQAGDVGSLNSGISNGGSLRSQQRSDHQQPTSIMQELDEQELYESTNIAPRVNPTPPIYAARTGVNGGGVSIIQTVLLFPFNVGYKALNTLLYFLSWLFPFLPRLTGYYPANRAARHTGSETGDYAKNAAARFIRSFEENYGTGRAVSSTSGTGSSSTGASGTGGAGAGDSTISDANAGESSSSSGGIDNNSIDNNEDSSVSGSILPFFLGGYTEALEKAKTDLKYLVVVLQSEEHDLTADFNRNVLLSPQVIDLLKREDIIFWAGNVKESEAYQVASGLEVTKFPFCALIAPSPRTPTSSVLVMTVLCKLQGATMDSNEFVSEIEERMEAHSPKILALVLDKQERDTSRRLREEQDSAYERSLQADRERLRKQEEERKKADEERERQEREAREAQEKEDLLQRNQTQWRQWRAQQLRKKLDLVSPSSGANTPSLSSSPSSTTNAAVAGARPARISLRLLSGERVVQLFSPTDTLEDLYAFVECHELLKEPAPTTETTAPPDFTFTYNFQLSTPMPRKVLEPSTDIHIADERSVYPSGSVLVETADPDDDEDNE
ncbi:Ubx3p [Sugiyamaella lignohabitans]|uniref:Ubx3p n=1 Tax=Sugiyamaella lignohabitans TaxID=796027 RepID=A0A161HI96_9ASCO|nr:Ubx3p [Sugiyamaella lignohabitans]ANB12137.1 Ubx3p [Sugiyamaella lignohabitans]